MLMLKSNVLSPRRVGFASNCASGSAHGIITVVGSENMTQDQLIEVVYH